jgi:hypothetical protein
MGNHDTSAQVDIGKVDHCSVGYVLASFTEGTASVDSLSKSKVGTRTITEASANYDTLSKFRTATRAINEGLASLDSIAKVKSAFKTFTENLAVLDILSKYKEAVKVLTEWLGIKQTLKNLPPRVIIERLGLADTVQMVIIRITTRKKYNDYPVIHVENDSV